MYTSPAEDQPRQLLMSIALGVALIIALVLTLLMLTAPEVGTEMLVTPTYLDYPIPPLLNR